jgi:hypothetical protein
MDTFEHNLDLALLKATHFPTETSSSDPVLYDSAIPLAQNSGEHSQLNLSIVRALLMQNKQNTTLHNVCLQHRSACRKGIPVRRMAACCHALIH